MLYANYQSLRFANMLVQNSNLINVGIIRSLKRLLVNCDFKLFITLNVTITGQKTENTILIRKKFPVIW